MLKEKLSHDLKEAMRAKDEARTRTIRSLRAALMEQEIAERQGGMAELSEEQELRVVQKQAKQRRESIDQYQAAGRDDLVQKEREELAFIEQYLPRPMSDEDVLRVLHEVIVGSGAATRGDLGRVMGEAMRRLKGRADGRRIQELAVSLLKE